MSEPNEIILGIAKSLTCPSCRAEGFMDCATPMGRFRRTPHAARLRAAIDSLRKSAAMIAEYDAMKGQSR